jgi:hypothetical protein
MKVNKKHIWISISVGFCIAFSIAVGDARDNLGLWLSVGVSTSSVIWFTANFKQLKKYYGEKE